MPPRIAVTFAMAAESRRTAAAVRTGKLDTPESTKTSGGARGRIEGLDAFHEVRSIGQIEVVNAVGDTGFDDPIPTLPIILKRPAGVDEDMRPERGKLRSEVAFPVEERGHEPGLGPVARLAIGARPFERAAGDGQDQARLVLQQFDDAAPERAIAADDQNAELVAHSMNRSAWVGSGR